MHSVVQQTSAQMQQPLEGLLHERFFEFGRE
jgi:hypothetical protein